MRASKIPLALACVLAVLGLAGCDSFFEVENPTDIEADDLDNQNMTTALANSPHIAVAEWYDFAVEIGGLPGDGVIHASNNQGNLRPDRGTFGTFTQRAENLYNGLASAQWTARETTEKLRGLIDSPDSDARVARGYYWDALARVTLADLYERVTFDGGPPHDPPEVYRMAIDILETAASIGRSAGDMEVVAAAEATIARAYRSIYFDTGGNDASLFEEAAQHAQAALDAQSDFVFYARYAQPGSENGLFDALANGSTYDLMDPKIAYIEDPASGVEDPRVQHTDQQGVGSRGDTIYWQQKYTSRDDDIPVSSWEEAVDRKSVV